MSLKISSETSSPVLLPSQVDCRSGFDSTQCNAASVSGTVSYPIDWTVGIGAVMNEDWCPMTLNTAADECPSTRFFVCDPNVSKTCQLRVRAHVRPVAPSVRRASKRIFDTSWSGFLLRFYFEGSLLYCCA